MSAESVLTTKMRRQKGGRRKAQNLPPGPEHKVSNKQSQHSVSFSNLKSEKEFSGYFVKAVSPSREIVASVSPSKECRNLPYNLTSSTAFKRLGKRSSSRRMLLRQLSRYETDTVIKSILVCVLVFPMNVYSGQL